MITFSRNNNGVYLNYEKFNGAHQAKIRELAVLRFEIEDNKYVLTRTEKNMLLRSIEHDGRAAGLMLNNEIAQQKAFERRKIKNQGKHS
jgi:hypothetical protein